MELMTFWFVFSNLKSNPSKKITLSLSVTRALFQLGLSIYVLKAFGLVAFMAFTFNGLVRLVMWRVSKNWGFEYTRNHSEQRLYTNSKVNFHRIIHPNLEIQILGITDPSLWAPSTQKRHGIPKYSRSHMPMQQGTSNRVWLKPKEDKHWYHLNFSLVSRNFWKFSAITMQKCTAHFRLRNLWKLYIVLFYIERERLKKKSFLALFLDSCFSLFMLFVKGDSR